MRVVEEMLMREKSVERAVAGNDLIDRTAAGQAFFPLAASATASRHANERPNNHTMVTAGGARQPAKRSRAIATSHAEISLNQEKQRSASITCH